MKRRRETLQRRVHIICRARAYRHVVKGYIKWIFTQANTPSPKKAATFPYVHVPFLRLSAHSPSRYFLLHTLRGGGFSLCLILCGK